MDNTLHITNGSNFAKRLQQQYPNQTILSWDEMLCEGPAVASIFSKQFITQRIEFLKAFDPAAEKRYLHFSNLFLAIRHQSFEAIVLWFEYDLFCHINLSAVVTFLKQQQINIPLFLVCAGKIPSKEGYFTLSELNDYELQQEELNKILLRDSDTEFLVAFWNIYTSNNHMDMNQLQASKTQFQYMPQCMDAHLQRFPYTDTGINMPERMVLEAIALNSFDSERQLIGQLLRDQGVYGFGDLQWENIIINMKPYFNSESSKITLNNKGTKLLSGNYNAYKECKDRSMFGGSLKYNYLYNSSHKLLALAV